MTNMDSVFSFFIMFKKFKSVIRIDDYFSDVLLNNYELSEVLRLEFQEN